MKTLSLIKICNKIVKQIIPVQKKNSFVSLSCLRLPLFTNPVDQISSWVLFTDRNFSAWNVYNHGGAAVAMVAEAFLVKFPTNLPNGIYYAQVVLVYATFNWLLSTTNVATAIFPMVNWRERPLVACGLLFVALPVVGSSVGTLISFSCYRLRMLLFGRLFGRGPEEGSPAFEKADVKIKSEI